MKGKAALFVVCCAVHTFGESSIHNEVSIRIDSKNYQIDVRQTYGGTEFPTIARALTSPDQLRKASSVVTSIVDTTRSSQGQTRLFDRATQISLSGQSVTVRDNCSVSQSVDQFSQQCIANLRDSSTADHLSSRIAQLSCVKSGAGAGVSCHYSEKGQFKTVSAFGFLTIYPAAQALTSTIETTRSFGVLGLYLTQNLPLPGSANVSYRGSPLAMYLYHNQQRYKSSANSESAFAKAPLTLSFSDESRR